MSASERANASGLVFDRRLTKPDVLVLQSLSADIHDEHAKENQIQNQIQNGATSNGVADQDTDTGEKLLSHRSGQSTDKSVIATLKALNDPESPHFEPTVFTGADLGDFKLPRLIETWLFRPYVRAARSIVRVQTDVVMLTHLLLYFSTSVPSAVLLFYWKFTWIHAIFHFLMQVSYMGTYTLMMHQHIHMRGILSGRYIIVDTLFPYITDPLMGHTWNSYFYHHIKHHHVEGNGPNDLSSTLRYQRDNFYHFLHYVGRFYLLIWLDLPLYFIRSGRLALAVKAASWELGYYLALYILCCHNARATFVVFILPLLLLRLGLMVGNWGQHAFVDHHEPDSDYRSSITLIDVQSNRHSFNDGYHTSHHLNPLRHWREHPVSFLKSKGLYASEQALVFHDIDYIMITFRLLIKDYRTLAKCMVPIGSQIGLTLEERIFLLQSHVQQFSEDEIATMFCKGKK